MTSNDARGLPSAAVSSPTREHDLGATVALGLIKAYRYGIRPMLGQRCRFFPSCSEYAADAISEYGVFRGSAMGAIRLAKCHPWHAGGFDPVPPRALDGGKPTPATRAASAHATSTNP